MLRSTEPLRDISVYKLSIWSTACKIVVTIGSSAVAIRERAESNLRIVEEMKCAFYCSLTLAFSVRADGIIALVRVPAAGFACMETINLFI